MKLTEYQKQDLRELNRQFKNIVQEQQQNPSSFDNHINCLRKLEKVVERWMAFMSPYINWQMSQADKLLHAKFNIFKILKLKHKLGKYKKFVEEINAIFFDEELKQQIKLAFEGKHVTGFNVNINHNENSTQNYRGTFFEKSHVVTYSISFLDGTELKWNSLEDEQQLAQARGTFEEKVPQPIKPKLEEVTPNEPYSTESNEGNDEANADETADSDKVEASEQYNCSIM